ncbi:MAG: ATP-dependent DNA ligase [archaeon]|nr:ATP-dependent DNA ligase [archaeon]MDD2477660.1 ATP-dependent DNA ligase [Candidatus ainarchaeum sp.]MDD3084386.1 ATP-dependent DNA ligase [Candidatus ainarchaeum sp.]MDD4220842.1 ATP-dependent DNA ligase [Candidatus ainarchaeum sp.]MDD4662342.1 ATP-dependent DNA ligase [Candidatus ainarchaeum sp.]
MDFNNICLYFNKLENTNSRLEIAQILSKLFLEIDVKDLQDLVYFCKGEIGPSYKGTELNIGLSTVLSLVSRYLGQNLSTIKKQFQKFGDVGLVIYNTELNKKQSTLFKKELSFRDVYSTLEKISAIEGKGAIEKKLKLFESILFNLDKISAKYLVRFPISFRLGFSDSTIIDALSFLEPSRDQKEVRKILSDKYDLISDLGLIAKIFIEEGIDKVDKLNIKPFIPFKPALCERAKSFSEIIERVGKDNKLFIVDSKIDGFRQQIHKFKNTVKIFSRNEEDITSMFPDVVLEIKKIEYDFIIDCEAIAYDLENKKYHNFQITMQRKRKYNILEKSKKLPLHLKVFDILYFDGKYLTDLGNYERRKILEKYFDISEIIKPTEIIITNSLKELEDFFNSRIELGFEGIIVKDIDSSYRAGSRGFNWIKFKKSYLSNSLDTIDAVIVGAFYGQGRRSDGIGALLMAVFDKETNNYYTIAKLGTGLTDEVLLELKNLLDTSKLEKRPSYLVTNIDADVYVLPKIVVEINFDEITRSTVHTVCYDQDLNQGLALRFPRFVRLRDDKNDRQTTTQEEIQRLYELQG